jgi:vancomycin permeability regulator SanA
MKKVMSFIFDLLTFKHVRIFLSGKKKKGHFNDPIAMYNRCLDNGIKVKKIKIQYDAQEGLFFEIDA